MLISSIVSIRAYSAQKMFQDQMKDHVNDLRQAELAMNDISRWLSFRLECLVSFFSAAVAIYFVYFSQTNSGLVAFTLSIVSSFSYSIMGWVRVYNNLEVNGEPN